MNLELLAKSASKLFTLPEICSKIQDVIYDPSSNSGDIAKLIAIDPSLAARLLKIANSSFYNFSSQIDDLGRAVNIIGTEDLYNLALAASAPGAFEAIAKNNNIDLNAYWKHSVMTGLIGRNLAHESNMRGSEKLFLSGLFHNLGQLVVLEQLPNEFLTIEAEKAGERAPWEVEKEVLGYTYAEVSAELLKAWKMPDNILDMVQHQHQPEQSTDPRTTSYLHIASRTASQIEFLQISNFNYESSILPIAWSSAAVGLDNVQSAVNLSEINCQTMLTAMTGNQLQVV